MVDVERLTSLLDRVVARLEKLDRYAADPVDDRDEQWLDSTKYAFQTAIEACIDVAQHVVASEGLGMPSKNADAFRLLGTAEMLDDGLAERLAGAVGFRKVLVHGYADVDDARVVANLAERGDLRELVRQVAGLLDADQR